VSQVTRRVRYTISAEIARRPLLYPLGRKHGVEVNIRAGSMTDEGGALDLDLVGEAEDISAVVEELRAEGAEIFDAGDVAP